MLEQTFERLEKNLLISTDMERHFIGVSSVTCQLKLALIPYQADIFSLILRGPASNF